jgi:hypothetical protein
MDLIKVPDRGGTVHPYLAKAIAEERIADFIRVAEANRKAHDGAELSSRRRRGWHRRRDQASAAALCEAGC